MTQIRLVENGIFPITRDIDNNLITKGTDTGFSVAGTFQGEGRMQGIPSLFIRTSGCNLRCGFKLQDGTVSICDTSYASYSPTLMDVYSPEQITQVIKNNMGDNIKHVVISGGEPTLQEEGLSELLPLLKQLGLHITIETNGTKFAESLVPYIDLISMSPKLSASVPWPAHLKTKNIDLDQSYAIKHEKFRKNLKVIQAWIDSCYNKVPANPYYSVIRDDKKPDKDFQLKFVITKPEDVDEIKADYLHNLYGWNPHDIMLMPVGATREILQISSPMTAELAVKNGFRFTPRQHVEVFGDLRGV